jgi:hypothetical protein
MAVGARILSRAESSPAASRSRHPARTTSSWGSSTMSAASIGVMISQTTCKTQPWPKVGLVLAN